MTEINKEILKKFFETVIQIKKDNEMNFLIINSYLDGFIKGKEVKNAQK